MGFTLTQRQTETLAFIREYMGRNNMAPSVREIADGIGISSTSGTHRILERLEERGHILRLKGKARAMKIITETEN